MTGRRIPTSHAVPTCSWATTRGEERMAAEDAARREWLDRVCRREANGGPCAVVCACGRRMSRGARRCRECAAARSRMVALTLVVDDAAVARERG